MTLRAHLWALFALFALSRCAPAAAPDATADAGPDVAMSDDVATAPDARADDVAASDAVSDAASDAASDAVSDAASERTIEPILGTLRASCGTLRAMVASREPSFMINDLTFVSGEQYARSALSPGGQRLFDTPNAGGSSGESEIFAYEVLHYCEEAELVATETEIHYAPADDAGANSITDLLVRVDAMRVGVSVTRMYRPAPMILADADVRTLLTTKLQGINRSSMRVLPQDRWVKQVLHVFAVSREIAEQTQRVWSTLDATLRADTVVIVTVTHGGGFIYCNPDPPLGSECPAVGG